MTISRLVIAITVCAVALVFCSYEYLGNYDDWHDIYYSYLGRSPGPMFTASQTARMGQLTRQMDIWGRCVQGLLLVGAVSVVLLLVQLGLRFKRRRIDGVRGFEVIR